MHRIATAFFVGLLLVLPAAAEDAKATKITVQLRGAIGEQSVKALQETLARIPGIKFKGEEIKKGEEPRFYTNPFVIEIADAKRTDIGTLAKAVAEAKTPLREELQPGMNLIVFCLDQVDEPTVIKVRNALSELPGVAAKDRGGIGGSVTDAYLWIKIDGSGQAKLADIKSTIESTGVKIVLDRAMP